MQASDISPWLAALPEGQRATVRVNVSQAPPFTPEQRAKLAELLEPVRAQTIA
ncbi:MAG TPA: hypothetical protein VME67_03665 [Mycobacterium sp.]|nr:hypothetical protein [Mycobacterium sp.]HTX94000.1 hypothetical protein [Mycobacterium sp.]